MENCKQYIIDFVKRNGALTASDLLESIKTANGPKLLKKTDEETFESFLREKEETFIFKSNLVCLISVEAKCISILQEALNSNNGLIKFSTIENFFTKCDKGTASYIKGNNPPLGFASFINRNDDDFFLWQNAVFTAKKFSDIKSMSKDDFKAVEFLLSILGTKGGMSLSKLASHLNQAPNKVKETVGSTKPIILWGFVKEKPTFFKCFSDNVACQEEDYIDEIKEKCTFTTPLVTYLIKKLAAKQGSQTINQLSSSLSQAPADILSSLKSRSHGDLKEFLLQYPSVFYFKDDDDTVKLNEADNTSQILTDKLDDVQVNEPKPSDQEIVDELQSLEISQSPVVKTESNFIKNPQDMLWEVLGENTFNEISQKLGELNVTENNLELICFDIGRKPFIRITSKSDRDVKYTAHELNDAVVDQSTLDNIFHSRDINNDISLNTYDRLPSQHVIEVTNKDHRISTTLHTLRSNFQKELLIGITIFYQLHHDTPLSNIKCTHIEENFLAFPYDRRQTTQNEILNYLRCKAKEQVGLNHKNVVILDLHGRITGFDYTMSTWAGKARCVYCVEVKDIEKGLNEVLMLNPDCVITNCVVSKKILLDLKLIVKQGIQVIAMVPKYLCDTETNSLLQII